MARFLRCLAAAALITLPAIGHADGLAAAPGPGREPAFERGPAGFDTPRGRGMGFAPGAGLQRRHRAMVMRQRWAALGLSAEQRARLRDLHDQHARQAIEEHAQIALARLDLAKLVRADSPDPDAVGAQIDRIAHLRAEQMKSAFDLRMRARSVLTDDQLRRLQAGAPGLRTRGDM